MIKHYISLAEAQRRDKVKYKTTKNTFADFPRGTRVKIICHHCDGYFFFGEAGTVIENSGHYLGIHVQFDHARKFEDNYVQKGHGFNPDDLYRYKCQPLKKLRPKTENAKIKKGIDSLRHLLPKEVFAKLDTVIHDWWKELEKAGK